MKTLVDQYKAEMETYVKITQVNQDLLGRINIEGNINSVLIDPNPSTDEELVKPKRKQSPVQVHIQVNDPSS